MAPPALRCRTAFVSDIHLGTRGCQAERLLEFIRVLTGEELGQPRPKVSLIEAEPPREAAP